MSSTRVALASCLLAIALTAGAWEAVSAFPLHGGGAAPQLQPPPPSPVPMPETRESYHLLATHYFEIAQKDATLTPEQKLGAITRGIAAEDRALAIDPNFIPALTYKDILLRLQANLTSDQLERQRLMAEADELRQTVIALRGNAAAAGYRALPPPPPPPPPSTYPAFPSYEGFDQLVQDLKPLRVGGNLKQPLKIHDVRPVYPQIAQESRVQGVVIVETLIGADGTVEAARVLRSIPLLDQAALDAVRQWQFTPPLLNGAPQAVVMTVTVNFSLE